MRTGTEKELRIILPILGGHSRGAQASHRNISAGHKGRGAVSGSKILLSPWFYLFQIFD